MEAIKELWLQYYPVILTVGGTIVTFAAGALIIWSQVKPIYEKVVAIFDKVKNSDKADITSQLQALDMETKITDLKAKLENPTISEPLKQQYMVQLQTAIEFKAKLEAGLVKVEETTNKYL